MTQINVRASPGISDFVKHALTLIYACSRTSHEFYSDYENHYASTRRVHSRSALCATVQIEFYILEIPIITAFNLLQNDIGLKSSNGDLEPGLSHNLNPRDSGHKNPKRIPEWYQNAGYDIRDKVTSLVSENHIKSQF